MKTSRWNKTGQCLAVAGLMTMTAMPAMAALSNSFFKPTVSEYWEDAANWYDEDYATPAGAVPAHWTNARFAQGYLCRVKSHVSQKDWSYRQFGINIGEADGVTASLFLENGAYLSANWCQVGASAKATGVLSVAQGAEFQVDDNGLYIGANGRGIVTNAGTVAYYAHFIIGANAGGWGTWVQDGGTIQQYGKDLVIGQRGRGELIVKSGSFCWPGVGTRGCGTGDVFVGHSQQDNALVVKGNAEMTCEWLTVGGAIDNQGGRGTVTVESDGKLSTTQYLSIGSGSGSTGIVTNRGTIVYNDHVILGEKAGSHGVLVLDGGSMNPLEYEKDLYVGRQGRGEVVVRSGELFWKAYVPGAGGIYVGQSQEDNRLTLEDGASMRVKYLALGGYSAGAAGRGELLMRGGRYVNDYENHSGSVMGDCETIYVGACPTAEGGVDAASYGRIRGWGAFVGWNEWRAAGYGARIRLGNGEILADGEGDEAHVLDSNEGLNGVASATPGQPTASGWRAVNKGAAVFPCNGMLTGGQLTPSTCVGCAPDAATPDLVNAVRVTASGFASEWATSQNKWLGVMLLATDREDAHVAGLPSDANVLSVHKIGLFHERVARTAPASCTSAQVTVRYDQTKIQKAGSRLELWRHVEGGWRRVGRLSDGERPAGCTVSSSAAIASVDETYNLGTFAVVERGAPGLLIFVR